VTCSAMITQTRRNLCLNCNSIMCIPIVIFGSLIPVHALPTLGLANHVLFLAMTFFFLPLLRIKLWRKAVFGKTETPVKGKHCGRTSRITPTDTVPMDLFNMSPQTCQKRSGPEQPTNWIHILKNMKILGPTFFRVLELTICGIRVKISLSYDTQMSCFYTRNV